MEAGEATETEGIRTSLTSPQGEFFFIPFLEEEGGRLMSKIIENRL
jgi:hypothetical protein